MSYGQAITGAKTLGTSRPSRRIRKATKVKLTLKQRFRNWLNSDNHDSEMIVQEAEPASLSSEGMRMQIYKANGGYVVETRQYDNRTDRQNCTMHVITEEQDLGDCLGKIVMMEALKR